MAVFTIPSYRKINIFGNQTYLYKAADIYICIYLGVSEKDNFTTSENLPLVKRAQDYWSS